MNPASRSVSVERRNSYRREGDYDRERPEENRNYGGNGGKSRSRSRSIDRSAERPTNKGNVLYVGNLSRRLREEEFRDRFERYGKIENVQLIKDPSTQECRGFGFVEFAHHEDAAEAVKVLDQSEFDGRKIRVEVSKRGVGYERTPGKYLGNYRSNYNDSRRGPRRSSRDRYRERSPRRRYSRSHSRERRRYDGGRYRDDYRDRSRDRYNDHYRSYRDRSRSRSRGRR